jgi:uncharacterized membrane protein YphA (DoxX/SURF4 family)
MIPANFMHAGARLSAIFYLPGRVLFGFATAAQGVVCLYYRDFIHSLQPVPAEIPGYDTLSLLMGVFLVAAGFAIVSGVRARSLAILLAAVFVLGVALLHAPGAYAEPELLRSAFWIRSFESIALAGAAMIVAGSTGEPRPAWVRMGRIVFGFSLPVFGILHFIYPDNVAALVATATPVYPWPLFWAYATGAGHILAGAAIVTGLFERTAAILAGCMYGTWALTLHLPRLLDHPAARSVENPGGYGGDRGELTSLFVCVAFWGAAWIVAGSLGARRPAQ